MQGMSFDTHIAATHRLAADGAEIGDQLASAGESKVSLEMCFGRLAGGEAFHSGQDLNQAFLALALFAAGRWDFYAQIIGAVEQGPARTNLGGLAVKMEFYAHSC
jgi:hypothetical protein